MSALDQKVADMDARIREILYVIPNIIDPSVPLGPLVGAALALRKALRVPLYAKGSPY